MFLNCCCHIKKTLDYIALKYYEKKV